MRLVKIMTMPPRKPGTDRNNRELRPIYVLQCPDCRGTRVIQVTTANGMRYVRKCQRCQEVA